ncbi:MAG TPA: chromate efflux transporter [Chthonomonadaceae bacterium]|nr:chromate efflux transporter [Chthonomonadaceae bacterium]
MNSPVDSPSQDTTASSLRDLAALFLRLGVTAFGGPAAHIAMMEAEVVRRRRWLTREQFLDLIGASSLIPGPSSTETAIFIGYLRAGWMGLVLGGLCFILPAALMVMLLAWAYVRFGHLPQVAGILYGVKPVIIAVIAQALWLLGRAALKTRFLAAVGLSALVLSALNLAPLAVLFGAGMVTAGERGIALRGAARQSAKPLVALLAVIAFLVTLPLALRAYTAGTPAVGLPSLFLIFLKIGSIVYGSGYVLLAFLRADLVARTHWLSSAQLLDAVAVGQVTPGPVFTTATFIGYMLYGPRGALAATVGIFLPAFLLVAVSGPLLPRLRQSEIVGAFLDGVNAAALALMAVVTWQLGRAAIVDALTGALALASLLILLRFRLNSAWLVLAGALAGLLKLS